MELKDINGAELSSGDTIVCVAISDDFNVNADINKLGVRFAVNGGHLLSASMRMAYYMIGCENEEAFRLDKCTAKRFSKALN